MGPRLLGGLLLYLDLPRPVATEGAMTALIVLGVIVLAVIGALVFVARWGMKAKDETVVVVGLLRAQERLTDSMQWERDDWKRQHDVAQQQLAVAKVRLTTAEAQRNISAQAATTALVEKVRSSNASTAADVLNALVGSVPVLSAMPKASDASAADGDRGAAGVRPAATAAADHEAGRLPKP